MIDFLISGAGLVGTSLALALEQAGFSVTLIDARPKLTPETCQDIRTVALSLTSVKWLTRIGAWDALPKQDKSAFTAMCVFEPDNASATLAFSAQSAGLPCLGYIVSHDQLLLTLQNLLKSPAHYNHAIQSMTQTDNEVTIHADKAIFKSRLLIGCDGADSFLRRQLNITHQTHDYHQRALVAELQTEQWHAHTAWQSFSHGDVMGLLPLTDRHRVNMIWSLDSDLASQYAAQPIHTLQPLIQNMFGDRLGTLSVVSPHVASFPLVARHAHQYGEGRVILLGDSIRTVHPLAGQGVNLGFLDAKAFMESIQEIAPARWHTPALRHAFERKRKAHNFVMMHLMTALQKIYAKTGMMATARQAGVNCLNVLTPIKSMIAKIIS